MGFVALVAIVVAFGLSGRAVGAAGRAAGRAADSRPRAIIVALVVLGVMVLASGSNS